ncbi:hypothetical protein [Mesorhizobium australicum]|uniref:Uncharacterized protein n=1 Tax=Mesorhizobium australicum TaxID=536018 RepID=A0A1X7NKL5_9HYPH|nr:hypothetical protein [Mesorhizobium australicum]SMH38382.1 hypothetical protein SAMN02982922_2049 [Mesorhizobium australicum]
MTVPKTRNWEAWIDLMPGSPSKLIVTGQVETTAGNKVPRLTEAKPQGVNPKILILDLSIVKEGDVGTDDVSYRDARFTKPASRGQYTQVEIRFGTEHVTTIEVGETH